MREPRAVGRYVSAVAGLLVLFIALAAYAVPLVTINKPQNLQVISGTADIDVSYAADTASPIERVQVFIDGELVKDCRLEKPNRSGNVAFRWDFTLATPSRHSISARAQDASGAVGTTGIKVEVRRNGGAQPAVADQADGTPPSVDIFYPAEGQVVSGEVRIKADVSDNVGVRTVVFFLDGEFKTLMMNSPNYSYKADTTRFADGPHVVRVSAFDARENEGKAERTFVVQNREATLAATGDAESRVAVKGDLEVLPPAPEVPPDVVAPSGQAAPASVVTDPGRSATSAELIAKLPEPLAAASAKASVSRPEGIVAPRVAALPTEMAAPPSLVKAEATATPTPRPVTSGVVTTPATQTETYVEAAGPVPEWTARPLSSNAEALRALPPPATRDAVRIAGIAADASARTHVPPDAAWQPRTTRVLGYPAVILAEPTSGAGYAADPVGPPRQARVAMLPSDRDGGTKTKVAMPGIDIQQMARFRDVKIVLDGKLIPLRAAPEVVDGISISPLREVFEGCDGTLYWFHKEKRVHAVNPSVDMELKIGRGIAKVNGEEEGLALAPYIKNGRTMVPLEFLATTLDVTVSFNSTTGELIVSRND